jgi:hypothetical protein
MDDTTLVGHSGECPGYRTTIRLDPRRKLAVIVLVNAMGVSPEDIAAQLLKLLGPALKETKAAAPPPAAPAAELERFAGL